MTGDGGIPAAIRVIDSHTEGEPTRVVIDGWPQPPGATMAERREHMRRHQDALRRAVVLEPRGHDAVVGALLTPPVEPGSAAGVVFFNNVGYLGMCGHGLIGVVRTLEWMGRSGDLVAEGADAQPHAPGQPHTHSPAQPHAQQRAHAHAPARGGVATHPPPHPPRPEGKAAAGALPWQFGTAPVQREIRIDTPVGTVGAGMDAEGITIRNVPARVHALDVRVDVPGLGTVVGDVAWGGNWFFIAEVPGLALGLAHLDELARASQAIMRALRERGITGEAGAEIDHIELYTHGVQAGVGADAVNYVLCPGGAYDRSPCGTGTSAKLATLHARGMLAPGQVWRQASVTGGAFTGWLEESAGVLVPRIRGRAFITADATLHFDAADPFRGGFGGG